MDRGPCACRGCVWLYCGLDACASWGPALRESPRLRADHLLSRVSCDSGSIHKEPRQSHTSPSLYAQKYTPRPITWYIAAFVPW